MTVRRKGKKVGIGSVMISNGYINEEPLRKLSKNLLAVKIDLKSFSDKFYKDYCSGELGPVLKTLQLLKELGMWFEIVVLVKPSLNDSPAEIKEMVRWIQTNLGPDVPLHFTRLHPMYKIKNLPPTSASTLETCHKIAKEAVSITCISGMCRDTQQRIPIARAATKCSSSVWVMQL